MLLARFLGSCRARVGDGTGHLFEGGPLTNLPACATRAN